MKLVMAEAGIFAGEQCGLVQEAEERIHWMFVVFWMSIFTIMFRFNIQTPISKKLFMVEAGIFARKQMDSYKEQKNEFTGCFIVFWMGIFTIMLGMVTTS